MAIWIFGEIAKVWLAPDDSRVRLVDVVLGQLSVFLNSFSSSRKKLLNFGRRPSQNPQKLTLAALKFGVGNVKNRRFQLGLVRFLPGFYRNTHREPLNTATKGFGLEPQRSTGLVFGLKSDSRRYQPVISRALLLLIWLRFPPSAQVLSLLRVLPALILFT